jgi:hypothetical protein
MSNDTIEYDEHGNFVIDGELEIQWMELHRDIQTQYRTERLLSFIKGIAGITAAGFAIYLVMASFYLSTF